ncbi:MAG: hypothetical protein Kow0069_09890 [Promethearchaeota archaeon]
MGLLTWDLLFKLTLKELLKGLEVATDLAVVARERRIDVVVKKTGQSPTTTELKVLTELLGATTLIEFKSARDRLEEHDLFKVLGYLGMYASNEKIPYRTGASVLAFLIVCSKTPKFKEEYERNAIILPLEKQGAYVFNFPITIKLVIVDELEICQENLVLLLFASGDKLREVMRRLALNELNMKPLEGYIIDSFLLNYDDVKVVKEMEAIIRADFDRNIRRAIEHFGVTRVVEAVGVERVVEAAGVERVVEAVGVERVVEAVGVERVVEAVGAETILRVIGPERVRKLLEEMENRRKD